MSASRITGRIGAAGRVSHLALGSRWRAPVLREAVLATRIGCTTSSAVSSAWRCGRWLCRKHGVDGLDLLLIDAEGHDYELIKQIDLAAHHPRLLAYELGLLSPAHRRACRRHVEQQGYATIEEGLETWCLDTRPDDRVTRAWHRPRPGAARIHAGRAAEMGPGLGHRLSRMEAWSA